MALQRIVINDFTGGLNDTIHKSLIADNESPDCSDVWTYNNTLTKRPGNFAQLLSQEVNAQAGANQATFPQICIQLFNSNSLTGDDVILFGEMFAGLDGAAGTFVTALFATAGVYPFRHPGAMPTLVNMASPFSVMGFAVTASGAGSASDKIVLTAASSLLDKIRVGDIFASNETKIGSRFQLKTLSAISGGSLTATTNSTLGSDTYPGAGNTGVVVPKISSEASSTALGEQPKFLSFNNNLYIIVNKEQAAIGTGGYAFSSSATASKGSITFAVLENITAWPKAKCAVTHKRYVFLGNEANSSRLRWSALDNPELWPAENTIDINKNDGQELVSLYSFAGGLLIFKQKSVYILIGDIFDPSNPTYQLIPIRTPDDFLLSNRYSIVTYKDIIFILSDNGLFIYPGGPSILRYPGHKKVDTAIFQHLKSFPNVSNFINNSCLYTSGNSLFMTYARSATGAAKGLVKTLVLDDKGSFWNFASGHYELRISPPIQHNERYYTTSPGSPDTSTQRVVTEVVQLLIKTDGNHRRMEDVLLPISGYWFSKEFNKEYTNYKNLVLYYKKQVGTLSVEWSIDQIAAITSTANMNVGRGDIVRKIFNIDQNGTTIQFAISNGTVSENFEIYRAEIWHEPYEFNRLM